MEADSVPYRASARGSRQARAAYDTLRCTFWWSSGVAWSTPTPHHPGAGSLTPAGSTVACACFMLLSCSPYADCTGASRCGARGYAPLHWSRNQVSNIPEIILGASPRGPKRSIGVPGCAHGSLFREEASPICAPQRSCKSSLWTKGLHARAVALSSGALSEATSCVRRCCPIGNRLARPRARHRAGCQAPKQ